MPTLTGYPHQSVERRQSRHFRADCAEGRLVPHPRLVTWSVFVRTNVLRGRGKQGPAPPSHNTNPNPNQSIERRQSRHFRADCAEGWLVSEECGRGRQVRARAWAAVKRFGCDQLAPCHCSCDACASHASQNCCIEGRLRKHVAHNESDDSNLEPN